MQACLSVKRNSIKSLNPRIRPVFLKSVVCNSCYRFWDDGSLATEDKDARCRFNDSIAIVARVIDSVPFLYFDAFKANAISKRRVADACNGLGNTDALKSRTVAK